MVKVKFAQYGGIPTIESYCGDLIAGLPDDEKLQYAKEYINTRYKHHISFLSNLPLYHEDNEHIYVHAGLNPSMHDWKEQSEHDFMYIRAPFLRHPTVVGKIVVFGHSRVKEIHGKSDIWFGEDKIGVDGGCAYGDQLNCLEIEGSSYRTYFRSADKNRLIAE